MNTHTLPIILYKFFIFKKTLNVKIHTKVLKMRNNYGIDTI